MSISQFFSRINCFTKIEPTPEELAKKIKQKQVEFLVNLYATEIDKYSRKRYIHLCEEYTFMSKKQKCDYGYFEGYVFQKTMEQINRKKTDYYIKKNGFTRIKDIYEKNTQQHFYDTNGNKTDDFMDYVNQMALHEEENEYIVITGNPIVNEQGEKNSEYLEFQAEKAHLLDV